VGLRKNTKYVRIAGVPDEIRIGRCCYINLFGKPANLQTNRYMYLCETKRNHNIRGNIK